MLNSKNPLLLLLINSDLRGGLYLLSNPLISTLGMNSFSFFLLLVFSSSIFPFYSLIFISGAFFISAQPSAAFFLMVAEGSVVWL